MIQLQQASLQLGGQFLLESADLTVYPGQKIGLIGPNGAGKTSLFKLLLGQLGLENGHYHLPKQWRLAHMAQEVDDSQCTALGYILDGDDELRRLEAAIERAGDDGEALAHRLADMERIDGYSAPARAQQLLSGLGFAPGDDERPVRDFSGGWRVRLNLARALMTRSDLLLLDEPSNHLDLDATVWLEQWLQRYPGTLVIISHDRDFLDNVVDTIVSIEHRQLISYKGNYSAYERQRAERLSQQQASFEKQQAKIAHMEKFIRRFRAQANKATQAQSRLKELEKMEKIAPAHVDSPFDFHIPCADKVSTPLVSVQHARIGYDDTAVLDEVNLSILPGSRYGLLGPNGAGKSSLIKTLAGDLPLVGGELTYGQHFRLGYFAQHQLEALDLSASAATHVLRISPEVREQTVRDFLGSFDFRGDRAFEPIHHFSGGEKARLALALIAWEKPNVLLLDEPTNHLDLEVRHALNLALQEFAGAVILVSHDRHLLRNTVDQFLLVADGNVSEFDGTLDDYHRWLSKRRPGEAAPATSANKSGGERKQQRREAAEQRRRRQPLSRELKRLEQRMEKLRGQLAQLETKLADPELYEEGQKAQLTEQLREQGQLQGQLDECEERWLAVGEELEALSTPE